MRGEVPMRLFLLCLVTSSLLLQGCGSLPTHAQLETWKANTDKTLATAADWADKAKKGAEALEAKYAKFKEEQAANVAKLEAIAGPMDADGDGKVTTAEATAFVKNLGKSKEGRDAFFDWQTWVTIAGAWVGLKGTKKVASVVANVAYKHGRDLNGDGVVDEEEAKAS